MNKFTQLQLKTGYTFLGSIIKIDDLISFAKKNKLDTLAITEENVMYSALEFYKKCIKNNIKPIIGIEIKQPNYNFIIYAKNIKGYYNLIKISSLLQTKKDIEFNSILKFINNDNLIVDNSNISELKKIEDYYTFNDVPLNDVRFLNKEDSLANHIVKLIGESKTFNSDEQINDINYFKIEKNNHIVSEIINKINLKIDLHVKFHLNFSTPDNIIPHRYLEALCVKSLKEIFKSPEIPLEYHDRLMEELLVIKDMKFEEYFLIVWDYVNFARKSNIYISPGRGSVGGSLVSYLLKITTIDPIKNNLLFERFLNRERVSMPDIDLDFEDERRDEVIQYIINKYGKESVSQIITFQTIKGRSSVRDIARVMKIDLNTADKIAKSIPLNTSLQEAYSTIESLKIMIDSKDETKKLFDIAIKIDGLPRQFSTHAAGIVIAPTQLNELCPVKLSGSNLVTQYSMEHLEDIGLIKFDILGLRNLTILKTIIDSIYKLKDEFVHIDKIPTNDPEVFKIIADGDTSGIFQLESSGMRQVLKKMKPESLEDIIATSSLFRPGPQENIPSYIKRKNNKEKIDYIDDSIESILKPTYGIIVYQEQIMKIVQVFASMSLSKADILRRAIGKKDEQLLKSLKEDFIIGARKNGHNDEVIKKVYLLIEKFANYGFNRSHAYGYSLLGYQLAYLKTYYPLEFMASLLSSIIGSSDKTSLYIQEAKKHNIRILGPSINNSYIDFTIENNAIRFSLLALKQIGGAAVKEIINEREENDNFKDIFDFFGRMSLRKVSKTVIESLVYSGSLDEFGYNRTTILNNLEKINTYIDMTKIKKGDKVTIDLSLVPAPKLDIIDSDEKEISKEFEILGFYLKSHPIKKVKEVLEESKKIKTISTTDAMNYLNLDKTYVVQIISVRHLKTKYGQAMAFATGQDENGTIDLALFPGKYDKYREYLERSKILLITAKAVKRQSISLNISDIKVLK